MPLLSSHGTRVRLWGYDPQNTQRINRDRENKFFLKGFRLPDLIEAGSESDWPFEGSELVVSAVPCQFLRSVWQKLSAHLPGEVPIVSVTKGIEIKTLLRPTQILRELCGDRPYAMLSGPSIANEAASGPSAEGRMSQRPNPSMAMFATIMVPGNPFGHTRSR